MPFFQIPFINQSQIETNWCWAAVAANVYNAVKPAAAPALTPCDVAGRVWSGVVSLPPAPFPQGGPCQNPDLNNATDTLRRALDNLGITEGNQGTARLSTVVAELSEVLPAGNEPVCAEVDFPNGATHFVAISALDSDQQHLWIEDPELGPGNTLEFAYQDFLFNYNYSMDANLQRIVQGFQKVERR